MPDLYMTDSYRKELDTKIKSICEIRKNKSISLVENIFYPGGGGQPPDKGTIFIGESAFHVLKIQKMNGQVFLSLEGNPDISVGESVRAAIDWDRRYAYMRAHTAAHVMMGVLKREAKNYAPVGINISETVDSVTVVFEGQWNQKEETAKNFIETANKIIQKDLHVMTTTFKDIGEAIEKYRDIYRGPKEFRGEVRIVIIDGLDANPCGGTHVRHLSEIGSLNYLNFGDQEITFSLQK